MWKFSVLIVLSCTFIQLFVTESANGELAWNKIVKLENANQENDSKFSDVLNVEDEFQQIIRDENNLEIKEWKELSDIYPRRKRSVNNVLYQGDQLNTGTADDTTQYKNDSVSKTTFVVYKVRKQLSKLIASQTSSVKLCITEAEDSLKKEYEELLQFTSDTQSEANEDGTDIQRCFDYTKNINISGIFLDCEITDQHSVIDTQRQALDETEEAFNEDVKYCERQYDESMMDQCLQEKVDNTRIKVFKIWKTSEVLISMVSTNRFNCIEHIYRRVDDGINKAATDFNACVEKIMDTNA